MLDDSNDADEYTQTLLSQSLVKDIHTHIRTHTHKHKHIHTLSLSLSLSLFLSLGGMLDDTNDADEYTETLLSQSSVKVEINVDFAVCIFESQLARYLLHLYSHSIWHMWYVLLHAEDILQNRVFFYRKSSSEPSFVEKKNLWSFCILGGYDS